MNSECVKGFRDFVEEEAFKREEIRKILVEIFQKYGFEPAETPIVEYEEFVKGENSEDEAVSDIFRLRDKGERKLALRYEFTFQLKRLMKNQKLPYKRYSIGPVFRDEPVSGNRLRQFVQCDVDIVGATIKDEAEILAIANNVLSRLGIDFVIYVNNRKLLNEILKSEGINEENWENVIREIDKLDKLPENEVLENLSKYNAKGLLNIIKQPEEFFERYESYQEIRELKKYCLYYGVSVKFSPSLARGLSYYNGSVFEIKGKGIKETITAGGSFMFNNVQSTGISFGLDRLTSIAKIKLERERYMIISLGKDKEAIELSEKMRKEGKSCMIYYGKPTKALEYANSKKIKWAIFVGEKEIETGKIKIKNLISGEDKSASINTLEDLK